MRILFSINNLGLGGVQTFLFRLANGFNKAGHEVIIYSHFPYFDNTNFYSWLENGIKMKSIKPGTARDRIIWKTNKTLSFTGFNFWNFFSQRHYEVVLKKTKPDIIISFDKISDLKNASRIFARNIPFVVSMHGSYDINEFCSKGNIKRAEIEKVFKIAKGVIYLSPQNIRIFKEFNLSTEKIQFANIYNGFLPEGPLRDPVEIRKQINIGKDDLVFGMISRGIPEKGWLEAILAFKRNNLKNAHLVLVGDSDYLRNLKIQFFSENIHFVGQQNFPTEWANMFDIGILPTYWKAENLPGSIIEYLYCGKPVISTNIGEIKNMVTSNGKTAGFILELNPKKKIGVNILAKTMLKYKLKSLRKEHSDIAIQSFKKFKMDICISKYQTFLRSILLES